MQATRTHLGSHFQTSASATGNSLFQEATSKDPNQAVLYAGKSVCQYIDLKEYHSGTEEGVVSIFRHYEDAFLLNSFRKHLKLVSVENELDKTSKSFLGKSASKVLLGDPKSKKRDWIGNCGEKAEAALFHLLKYYSENIKSIEILTIFLSKDPLEFQHCVLVLNRDPSSEAFPDPSCWRPVKPGLEVVIVDPSFNKTFFAKDYRGNLVSQYAKKHAGIDEIFNQYVAYQPNPDLFILSFDDEILSQNSPLIKECIRQKSNTHKAELKSLAIDIRKKIAIEWFKSIHEIEKEKIQDYYSLLIAKEETKRAQLDSIFPDDRAYGL